MLQLYNQNGSIASIGQTDLIFVNGSQGPKEYPMNPNSRLPLFEKDDDVMYIVSTDTSNFRTIQRFRLIEEPEIKPEDKFDQLKGELGDVKQSVAAICSAIESINAKINSTKSNKPNKRYGTGRYAKSNEINVQSITAESESGKNIGTGSTEKPNIEQFTSNDKGM